MRCRVAFVVLMDSFQSPQVQSKVHARFLNVTSLAIEELPGVIRADVEDVLEDHPRSPAARLRPRMGMVGDM